MLFRLLRVPTTRDTRFWLSSLVDHKGNKAGKILLCVDSVQAGIGDLVLVVDEGGSANFILGRTDVNAIRAVVTGIVDEVDVREL